jgi:hypothetical protein
MKPSCSKTKEGENQHEIMALSGAKPWRRHVAWRHRHRQNNEIVSGNQSQCEI